MSNNEPLWVEKYRPTLIDDIITTEKVKKVLTEVTSGGNIPNMIFVGPPGVGKTTAARAIATMNNLDVMEINGSLNGGIDTLRNDIMKFASAMSFGGATKLVILDEADYLNPQSTQPALRNFMEEFSDSCRFILTANYSKKIIEPLHSRCTVVDFSIPKNERSQIGALIAKKVVEILDCEGINYSDVSMTGLGHLVKTHFPDFRRIINELQRHTANGAVEISVIDENKEYLDQLFAVIKSQDFTAIRKWVATTTVDNSTIFRTIYDHAADRVTPRSLGVIIVLLGEYQYKNAFAVDPQINLAACLINIAMEAQWQ